jgi:predicted kinase
VQQAIFLVTGIQAAGKSTVAQLLAEQLPRSVHVRGDAFRRMIVNDRVDMSPSPSDEAFRQLRLRYRIAAAASDEYFRAGFSVVMQDVVIGPMLEEVVCMFKHRPLLLVVLAPRPEAVVARERGRGKDAYDEWTVAMLDETLRKETPRLGLWLDTSDQTPAETVREILSRAWTEAQIPS